MCGIAGIIARTAEFNVIAYAKSMSAVLRHRGPDGEGFVISDGEKAVPCAREQPERSDNALNYLPATSLSDPGIIPRIALAHRRLSIIDLSEAGHEPMCDSSGKLWITYNGEIYNYPEIRTELRAKGFRFRSDCDTEVVLQAYACWGEDCVLKFTGMWAFTILDLNRKICFASRDRLGVKPFYYTNSQKFFAFASEQKAFVKSGLIQAEFDQRALHNYLVNGLLESEAENFFIGISELLPGHNLIYDLRNHNPVIKQYFALKADCANQHLSDHELTGRIKNSFHTCIGLRLRSDVEVGTCLSGGIDSSAIAVSIARQNSKPLHCFTAAFPGHTFDETNYAALIAKKIGGQHHITEPKFDDLQHDFDELIYSQDSPIWDTSTYAQHRVMRLAKQHGIKVVLDGQGADELFTGYHHHFTAKWNNLLLNGHYTEFVRDIAAAGTSLSSPLFFYLKEKLKGAGLGGRSGRSDLLATEFRNAFPAVNPFAYKNNVNEQLIDDITRTRLKIFLKCEDRCGMWHGVESRTPFSDDENLISLMFSFDGNRKIKHGRLKYFLREALKEELPDAIYTRTDKRGFETPMQQWVSQMQPKMNEEILAAGFDFTDNKMLTGKDIKNGRHHKILFKLFVLARWKQIFKEDKKITTNGSI